MAHRKLKSNRKNHPGGALQLRLSSTVNAPRAHQYYPVPTGHWLASSLVQHALTFPIISGLATLIVHLGGEETSVQEIKILTHQVKDDALELHTASMPPKMPLPPPVVTTRNAPSPQFPQYPILPPGQIKSSLKTGKFHPVIASTPPPC